MTFVYDKIDKELEQFDINYILYSNFLEIQSNDTEFLTKITPNVKYIKLLNGFNQSLDNLPDWIEYIWFENIIYSNITITKYPKNLKKITLFRNIGFHNILNTLPLTLKYLDLYVKTINPDELYNLPPNLVSLRLRLDSYIISTDFIMYLPSSLRCLSLDMNLNSIHINLNNLPSNLKYLYIFGFKYVDLNNLPDSLEQLIVYYNELQIHKFPLNLKYLELDKFYPFKNTITQYIPNTIKLEHHIKSF